MRVRQRREAMGISQGRLGRHLGLTFSQVQKYEKGANRIGAGRLYQIAEYLGVSPMHFYEGLEVPGSGEPSGPAHGRAQHLHDELSVLTDAYAAIPDPETRKSVVALVKSLTMGRRPDNDTAVR